MIRSRLIVKKKVSWRDTRAKLENNQD